MVDELLQVGQRLFQWMETRSERIAVLVSADLSHTHRIDGPYGYSPASQQFDTAVAKWASNNPCSKNNTHALLHVATSLQPKALSCGFTGMIILHGMLCNDEITSNTGTTSTTTTSSSSPSSMHLWKSHVYAAHNVTYYGMMAVGIVRIQQRLPSTTHFLQSIKG
jgi:aromatic ring-opening dioxygenase LigB subunit